MPGLLIIRQDGMLFFANARKLRQEVLAAAVRQSPPPKVVLLDLEMSPDLDIQSADVLIDTRTELAASDVDLWLCGVHAAVRARLMRIEFGGEDGGEWLFADLGQGVAAFERRKERQGAAAENVEPASVRGNPAQAKEEAQP